MRNELSFCSQPPPLGVFFLFPDMFAGSLKDTFPLILILETSDPVFFLKKVKAHEVHMVERRVHNGLGGLQVSPSS